MKAGIIRAAGTTPVYGDFESPVASEGKEVISVKAAALSPLSKSRASGSHYSSEGVFPAVAGVDGVGFNADGQRVYFALPESPYGAFAEKSLVRAGHWIAAPDGLDDVSAAALANPGMSAWAALAIRANLRPGETVLVNGATGSAGGLAVQLAKYLGAGKVIATGRNDGELEKLKSLGADVTIRFTLDAEHPQGAEQYEQALIAEFAKGIDVVVDYLWGLSAQTIIVAIAKAVEDAHLVRFVHVGEAGGEHTIELPGAALRSSAIELMGSGIRSVPLPELLDAIRNVLEAAVPAKLQIATKAVPLSTIEETWNAPTKARVVFVIQ
jgi:NADPH:quinone reductase-like Zn-dependent oxidoreductase